MCGIVGYIGYDNAKELLLKGLEKLEYRGYDSAGIAVVNDTELYLKKKVVLQNYVKLLIVAILMAMVVIGLHTLATHGVPNHETLIHINDQMAVLL